MAPRCQVGIEPPTETLRLADEVRAEHVAAVFNRTHPGTADVWSTTVRGKPLGYDPAFRGSKSSSVLWALAEGETRREVDGALDRANQQMIGWLDDKIAFGRVMGADGQPERVRGTGLTVATYAHNVSRNFDRSMKMLKVRRVGNSNMVARHPPALDSAIARPINHAAYEGADVASQAAVLARGVAQHQSFLDRNKRTADRDDDVASPFNCWDVARSDERLADLILGFAHGLEPDDLADQLRPSLIPRT